jgi:hypothetical protein
MKVEILNETAEKTFEPIEIKLTIENLDELNNLWHRLNLSGDDISSKCDSDANGKFPSTFNVLFNFWMTLNTFCKERNQK